MSDNASLETLHTALIDARNGYAEGRRPKRTASSPS